MECQQNIMQMEQTVENDNESNADRKFSRDFFEIYEG